MNSFSMQKFIGFILICSLVSCQFLSSEKSGGHNNTDAPYLVVLSMDGFRWDYPMKYSTPNLDSIGHIGVQAKSLMPIFPSKTFPNHYTMATGLYPEHHGIVLNSFVDPKLGKYQLGDRSAIQNSAFYLGEPIWVTAEKQGVMSACFFWPGSEAPIGGKYVSIWKKYDGSVSFEARMDSVISWLGKTAENRPHLIMWYLDEPDHVGHTYGPNDQHTKQMVEQLDRLVGVFCKKINRLPCKDSINIVFMADHGMGEISPDRVINIKDHLKPEWVNDVEGGNPVFMLNPAPSFRNNVVETLQKVPHMSVFTKENMPESFHYTESDRIYDVVCVADSAWSIFFDNSSYAMGGTHGYDPANTDMHAIFYATGPAFKKHYIQPSFQNINLYSLFTEILEISPVATDGNLDEVKQMLIEDN